MPQTSGVPGWIVLTYDNNIPVCLWIAAQECRKLPMIVDERLCGDTFLRVEKISSLEFVVADIWMYNSNCVFACSTFRQRYEWLQKLLERFTHHVPGAVKLLHKSDLPSTVKLRGVEEHPDENIGKPGFFVEQDTTESFTIKRLQIPDCYEVVGKGYLRVPDIQMSRFLRTKGDTFTAKCVPYDDEFWDLAENIPDVK